MASVSRFIVFGLLVCCLFLIIVLTLWNDGLSKVLDNADLVQPYLVAEDLLKFTGTYHGWRHSPAPYVFPDWFLAGLLVLVPVPPIFKTALYAAISLTGFALAAGLIIREATGVRYATAVLIFALLLIGLILGTLPLHAEAHAKWFILTLSAPFIHNGATFGLLLATALMGWIWNNPRSMGMVVLLLIIVFMGAYSDLLFVVWFVTPAVVIYGIDGALTRRLPPLLMAMATGATAFLAVVLKRNFHGSKTVQSVEMDDIRESAIVFAESVQSFFSDGDVIMIGLIFGLGCICLAGSGVLVSAFRSGTMRFWQALILLLAGAAVCGLVVPVLSGFFDHAVHWRYLMVVPILVVLAASVLVAEVLAGRAATARLPGFAASILALLLVLPAYRAGMAIEPKLDLEVCLEAEGLTTGYGEYWMVKSLIFYSERRIHVIQLNSGAERYEHNYNRLWFDRRADGQALTAPNFIIMTMIDPVKILERFGPASRTLQCGKHEIWLYDRIGGLNSSS